MSTRNYAFICNHCGNRWDELRNPDRIFPVECPECESMDTRQDYSGKIVGKVSGGDNDFQFQMNRHESGQKVSESFKKRNLSHGVQGDERF